MNVRIGQWLARVDAGTLERAGVSVKVTKRAMDVLAYLADRAGETVTNAELLAVIAPEDSGSKNALHKCITELRHALGDDRQAATYIETVPRHGYRLVATVSRVGDDGDVGVLPSTPAPSLGNPAPRARASLTQRSRVIGALVLAVFMVGGALAYRTLAPSGDDPGAETAYEASIGVLRFRTVDGTPEDQRAADAIADAIIDWVAEWQRQCETQPEVYQGTCDARVAPREKSFAHTLENESVDAVGSALDVAFLIDGALQRFGDRQHVTVRIHRVATGELMYAYEDDAAGDPIRLVGTVTARVLPALRVVIGKPGDEYSLASMREDGTRSIDAYQAALDGVNVIQRPDLAHAAALFREAIRLDPSYVRAYGNLATVLLLQAEMSPLSDRASALEEIAQIRAQVARLDPGANVLNEIAMAQSRVGNARLVDQEAQLSGFIRLADSSDAIAFYDDYGQLLFGAHLFDEAEQYVRQNERSRAFDFTTSRVLITIARERPQLAAALLDRALLAWPNDVRLLSWAVPQLARRGDWDEAESCLAHLEQIDRDGIWSYTARVQFAVLRGDLPAGSEALSAALAHEHSTPLLRGAVRFMLGDVDGGVAEWRGMDAALVGLLGRDGPVTETLFPEAVLADLRYQDLLDELGVGRQWTAYLRDRVEALAPITGIHPAPITPAIVSSG